MFDSRPTLSCVLLFFVYFSLFSITGLYIAETMNDSSEPADIQAAG